VLLQLRTRIRAEADHVRAGIDERNPESVVIAGERIRDLARAFDELPSALREPLVLTALQERPQAAVARQLRLTRKAVEMRVRRARQRLRMVSAA